MSFFQPTAPQPEPVGPYGPKWSPPIWDRPSEGVVPAIVPVAAVLGKGDEAALVLQSVRVYPTGVVLEVAIMQNPKRRIQPGPIGLMDREKWPRVGVQFADGRRAGDAAPPPLGPMGIEKDEQGLPTEPVLMPRGGGGGGTEYRINLWLYPLPPAGPLRIFAEWPAIGLAETMTEVDGAAIEAASHRAITIWE